MEQARRWLVRGRVQGVGFRYFVQKEATNLRLSGWVRNLDSGEVEVYACGSDKALDTLAASLYRGPQMAEVRGVSQKEVEAESTAGFQVR